MSSHLALVTLLVRDMARAKAFYTELLGLDIVTEFSSPTDDFVFLHAKTGSTNIALQDAAKQTYGAPVTVGGIILGFPVADADAVYRDWQAKGVEIVGEVTDMGAGHIFTAKDPAGNFIQVYHLYPPVEAMQKEMGFI